MGSFANYAEDAILDHIVGKASLTMPTAYLGVSTADPTDDASGLAEPVGNGYARVTTSAANWNASSGGSITNVQDLTFPEASGSWGTLTHFALFDAVSGGNMLVHGALSASKAIGDGDTLYFPGGTPGDLEITLD